MKKILLIILVLLSAGSKAQVSLGMGGIYPTGTLAYSDTVTEGTTDTIGVWVKNYGPDPYTGGITVDIGVTDTTFTGVVDSVIANTNPVFVSGLAPGDSVLISYNTTYTVTPGGYRYGIDVIVVWPVSFSSSSGFPSTMDSLRFPVVIDYPQSVNELDINRIIKLYPNPGRDRVTIENGTNTPVETVIIYDQTGKAVLSEQRKNIIDIQSLAPGVYHAEVYLSDKKRYSIKFIKQKN